VAERQLPKLNVAGSIPVSRSKRIRRLNDSLHALLVEKGDHPIDTATSAWRM
jgi:hypothetical protein